MGLVVTVPRRLRRRLVFRFADDRELIVIGRDPSRCQVLFAPRVRTVGREHCALRRVLGRYRLVLNADDAVFVDGEEAYDGDELPPRCVVRLGRRGPRLLVDTRHDGALPPTARDSEAHGRRATPRLLVAALRWQRRALLGLGSALFGLVILLGLGTLLPGGAGRAVPIDDETALVDALDRIAPSVYRVLYRSDAGAESASGTAWVVAPGTLATNAHVAKQIEKAPAGWSCFVRSCDAHPRTLAVTAADLHPAFESLERLWQGFEPIEGDPDGWWTPIRSAGGFFDVALLHVEDASLLGPPLAVASQETLLALRPGEPVGFVGYPSENIALGGSPLARPAPHRHTGRVTSLTDYFGTRGAPEEHRLIQHDCPGTGGSSGSPLVNAAGQVVGLISAGNFAFSFRGRIPSGAGINYAQRADALAELIEHRAEDLQEARRRAWVTRLNELYRSHHVLQCERRVEAVLEERGRDHERSTAYAERLAWRPVATVHAVGRADALDAAERPTLRVPEAGRYVVFAVPRYAWPFEAHAEQRAEDETAYRELPLTTGRERTPYAAFTANAPGTLRFDLRVEEHPVDVVLRLYAGTAEPLTSAFILDREVDTWRRDLRRWRRPGESWAVETVLTRDVRLGNDAPDGTRQSIRFRAEPEVPYLVVVVAEEARPVAVTVDAPRTSPGPEEGRWRAEHVSVPPDWPAFDCEVTADLRVAPEFPLTVLIRIYRAAPAE